jgi:hypothetical protein
MLSILAAFLTMQVAEAAPAAPAPQDGVALFHDIPFKHPVTLLLRPIDPASGAFGETTLLVNATDFAAGSGRLHADGTVKQFHAAVLAPGTYAVIGKIERIPDGDVVKVWSTCRPKDAEIFEMKPNGRVLIAAPVGMTFDPAEMEGQLQQFLKADDAQLEKDVAAILSANPSFAGDYERAAPALTVAFKSPRGAEECLKPGPAKGKIVRK